MRAWVYFHECRDATSFAALAAAFAEACEAAEGAGCALHPAAEDAGDREVEARGPARAVAAAAEAFEERGFDPEVISGDEEELAVLVGLLSEGIAAELEATGGPGRAAGEEGAWRHG